MGCGRRQEAMSDSRFCELCGELGSMETVEVIEGMGSGGRPWRVLGVSSSERGYVRL